ncbi:uncharacterized protein LOC111472251 [Cucurbita maxima]|uniref:Uncharacterized protein LOC111472251 n=1 Tax=Cucurbita maxima TaxID=3661 RepID=A0A6J1I996_CUCMA|nr:uncharacterized protein LOC111472251 [Cucurbita maxima]
MPEKGLLRATSQPWLFGSSPLVHSRFWVLTGLVLLSMLAFWSIDGFNINTFIKFWSSPQDFVSVSSNFTNTHFNLSTKDSNFTQFVSYKPENYPESALFEPVSPHNSTVEPRRIENEPAVPYASFSDWFSAELEPNYTSNLLALWKTPGGEPCRDSRTADIAISGMEGPGVVELSTGDVHEFRFQAVDESGNPRCLGGDYFETDLSGEWWKSRPFVRDFGNGTYLFWVQVHPDFAGDYELTVILLFRSFEGLRFSPTRFAYDRELRRIKVRFVRTSVELPEIKSCGRWDFGREIWTGRWTRHGRNEGCEISDDGRYRCFPPEYPCRRPWCNGSLGLLESNGWVYSAHCSFQMFTSGSAWDCLKGRWIFFWGDSNHVDTIRNLLNFVLDLPEIPAVPRRFDRNFSNPKNPSQTVRITSIFNGHWNDTQNYEGLNSLRNEGFRNLLYKYFSEQTVPDTIIMNSGLHDGVHWLNIRAFSVGAAYAASFWKQLLDSIMLRGLTVPKVFYRTTVATGGYARTLAFNPNKMEIFNWVVLEKLKESGIIHGVIDNFDMTFPWHFDNRCNDGVHYGRAPAKLTWRDGQIGHQYFLDLMLAHILLNALCS